MKKVILLPLLLSVTSVFAQGWQPVGTGSDALDADHNVVALCYDNGALYAGVTYGDTSGYSYVAKWDGTGWARLGDAKKLVFRVSPYPMPIRVDKYHNVYTLGLSATNKSCVVKWDGAAWSELGAGSNALNTYDGVNTFCVDKDGNVYAAGALADSGIYNVAKWDGSSWSQLGTGGNALNGNNWIMALGTDSHGNVYAGGGFRKAGDAYVAKWDGTSWSSLDGGSPMKVGYPGDGTLALYIDEADNVYACGSFFNEKGETYIAKWNGATWTELGSGGGINSVYQHLSPVIDVLFGDKAGNIYIAGHRIMQRDWKYCVKKWNGDSWDEVGIGNTSLNAKKRIHALCTDSSGNLYAGGSEFSCGNNGAYASVAKFSTRTDVENISGQEQLYAWPNPADDELHVEVSKHGEYYYIYDIRGVMVKKVQNKMVGAATNFITVEYLPKGTYFLKKENAVPFVFIKN